MKTSVRTIGAMAMLIFVLGAAGSSIARANEPAKSAGIFVRSSPEPWDTTAKGRAFPQGSLAQAPLLNAWGVDVLISNDGFGLGGFYRRQLSEDISGFVSFSISESKDDREVEQIDPYTQTSYIPGKLNRFMVMPLMVGVQYRLFREDIVDTFRPYVNAGVGPTMVYVMPFVDITRTPDGPVVGPQIDFFKSIPRGQAHYTVGSFIGFGANFGGDKNNLFGVNFRYYFTYLFSGGLPSLYDEYTGDIANTKADFGGFCITLNIGMGY